MLIIIGLLPKTELNLFYICNMVANINSAEKILKAKSLNITEIRLSVISLLLEPGKALTRKEIEIAIKKFNGPSHRATLYRTLKILSEHKIIHQVVVGTSEVKYKLAGEHLKYDHPHFHCQNCNQFTCLPEMSILQSFVPGGYSIKSSSLMIEGMCALCNKSN